MDIKNHWGTRMRSYVFIGTGANDIKVMYSDFNKFDKSELKMLPMQTFKRKLSLPGRILLSNKNPLGKRNRRIFNRADFYRIDKGLMKKSLVFNKIDKNDDVVFIIYARIWEFSGNQIKKYLKRIFPKAKFVVYFGDVISSFDIDLDKTRNSFDSCTTFDKSEAEKYNFKFLQEPFSFVDYGRFDNEYDITFVGAAKNRLNEIYLAYEKAKNLGFKNDFHIFNVSDSEMKYTTEIAFNKWMSFEEVMEHVFKSNAIFEVMQKDGYSPTTRYAQALLYKKYLITNCRAFKDKKDLPPNIIYFENPKDIDFSKIKEPLEYDNKEYIKKFSIETYIASLEIVINEK